MGQPFSTLLKPAKPVGIVGYGAYVPRYRLPAKEVARVWTGGKGGLPIKEKAVPGLDEDVITMSIEAARNAMKRAQIDPTELRAVWVGSESHPYAVKPTSTLVAEAIGAVPNTQAADWEFACKAGTEALVAAMGLVGSGMGHYAMAIGVHHRPRGGVAGDHQLFVFIRHRHARLLAARISKVSRARHAIHGRTRLFQT
jgi:hydroxymethylglutaryl-CoA synthase